MFRYLKVFQKCKFGARLPLKCEQVPDEATSLSLFSMVQCSDLNLNQTIWSNKLNTYLKKLSHHFGLEKNIVTLLVTML